MSGQRISQEHPDAQAAGFDVGVYFFAQAVNEEEAREEADFVLQNLQDIHCSFRWFYDPESILDDEARTDTFPANNSPKIRKFSAPPWRRQAMIP